MGLGKITRGLGKVGALIEAASIAYRAGDRLLKAIKRKRSTDPAPDGARAGGDAEHHAAGDDRADDQHLQP